MKSKSWSTNWSENIRSKRFYNRHYNRHEEISCDLPRCVLQHVKYNQARSPSGGFRRDERGIKPERYMHRRLIKVDRVEIAYYLINSSTADKPIEAFSITSNESPSAAVKSTYLLIYTRK